MQRHLLFLLLLLPLAGTYAQPSEIRLLDAINKSGDPLLDKTFLIVTNSATPVSLGLPAGMIITGLLDHNKKLQLNGYECLASVSVASGFSFVAKRSINRIRPFINYPFIENKTHAGSPSFPSGHTTTAFATATSVSLMYPKWQVIVPAYLWASSVAYSRLYLGVHYPSDVLGGIIIGCGTALLTHHAHQWLNKKYSR